MDSIRFDSIRRRIPSYFVLFFHPSFPWNESIFLDTTYELHCNPIKVCGWFGERSPGRIQSS